jgi:hypothetical protein
MGIFDGWVDVACSGYIKVGWRGGCCVRTGRDLQKCVLGEIRWEELGRVVSDAWDARCEVGWEGMTTDDLRCP